MVSANNLDPFLIAGRSGRFCVHVTACDNGIAGSTKPIDTCQQLPFCHGLPLAHGHIGHLLLHGKWNHRPLHGSQLTVADEFARKTALAGYCHRYVGLRRLGIGALGGAVGVGMGGGAGCGKE